MSVPLARVVGIIFLVQTALFAIRPMVSYRALDLGASPGQLGLIAACFSVLSLAVGIPVGRWIDRRGEPTFVVAGSVISGLSSALLIGADSLIALAICHALLGFGHVMVVVGLQSLLSRRTTDRRRDTHFGAFTTAVSLGHLIGPALAGLLAATTIVGGHRTASVFAVGAAMSTLAAMLAVTTLRSHRIEESPDTPGRRGASVNEVLSIPDMRQAFIVGVIVVTALDVLVTYLPAYGEATGRSVQEVSFLLAVGGAAALAARIAMAWLVKVVSRRRLLLLSTTIPAVLLLALPFVDSTVVLGVLLAIVGFGLGLSQPITLVWVASTVPPTMTGAAFGVRISANRFGTIVIPLIVGGLAGPLGVGSIFTSLAVLLGFSGAVARSARFGTAAT